MYGKLKTFLIEYGKVIVFFVSILILSVALSYVAHHATPKKLSVSFLDVGQGDAILIQTPSGHDMLIDGGPSDAVVAEVHDELSFFDRDIEVMIATHGDADHITGLIPILALFDVQTIVRSPIDATTETFDDLRMRMDEEEARMYVGRKGDRIDFGDGVVAHVLYPAPTLPKKIDTNNASVSIVLVYGEHSFLLTGDLTTKYETRLLGNALPKKVTVYKAGHHGSKTSSGEQLLSYIKPEYAVISAAAENRYGHPHEETMLRLQKYSKEILSTADRGTISFISDGKMLEVETKYK